MSTIIEIAKLRLLDGELQYLNNERWTNAWTPLISTAPQTVTFSATPAMDYAVSSKGKITLEGDVTNLALSNVPDGGAGTLKIIQNGTGGYGIDAISHAGLTVQYLGGLAPTSDNINAEANGHTDLHFERVGAFLYVNFGATNSI